MGRHLLSALLRRGDNVTAVGRRSTPPLTDNPRFRYISADTSVEGEWQEVIPEQDVIVNLAGKSIFTRWTKKNKRKIMDSRILTTRNLVAGLPEGNRTVLCNASAVGYYGHRGEDVLTETEPAGDDFLARVALNWEQEVLKAAEKGSRVVLMRFGIVLGPDGGAMAKMLPAFRMFVGGRLGSGRQWFPWIHIADLVAAAICVMDHPVFAGPVNFCAPGPVRNREFVKHLAKKLHRPAFLPAPGFVIKTVMGELGEALLCSQRATPANLQANGFEFRYPGINDALADILMPPFQ